MKTAICIIIKDLDVNYLFEWIDYHRNIGFDKFYIYDNDSKIPIYEQIKHLDYVYVETISGSIKQLQAYNKCITDYSLDSNWIAFIDDDEFIVIDNMFNNNIKDLLLNYNDYSGICLNWKVFGSNGLKIKSSDKQIIAFNKRLDDNHILNKTIKIIVQPKFVKYFISPHACVYNIGFTVDLNKKKIMLKHTNDIDYSKACLNHYFLRSEQEFKDKIIRGRADNLTFKYNMSLFDQINKSATIIDNKIIEIYNNFNIK